jgi:DNA-binding response OmpR family regulator
MDRHVVDPAAVGDDRSMAAPSIWVIDDDAAVGASLLRTLLAEGYDTSWARSLREARSLEGTPDLVLLDRLLPDGDGVELCRELTHADPSLRVVLVTVRADEIDVVLGLDAGATDYVTKPFRLAELLARIRAQLRTNGGDRPARPAALEVGELWIDGAAREVRVAGEPVSLRPKEFDLLARLAADAGSVIRRETLMDDVWGRSTVAGTKTLDVHVAALRRRIDDPSAASRITTVRGVGYRLDR